MKRSVEVVYPVKPKEERLQWQWPGLKTGIQPCSNSGEIHLQGLEVPGWAAGLLSSWQERPCCPGPSGPLPVPGEAEFWAVSRRPVLRGQRCWILAPRRAATSPQSRRPNPYELLQEPRSPLHTAPLPLP